MNSATQNPNNLLENLRKVISLVDQLRDIGLQDYIKLPRIVVLGIQSSGKSSLLEQIVGIDFLPRGDVINEGVVTRRPLELRLSYVNKAICPEPYAVFEELKGQKFTDFAKVKENIIMLTDKVAGTSKNIVDNPIILQVFGPACPDLTLVDLPGITRIPINGQSHDIEAVTKNMAKKYCQDPKTIILCVVAANQDLSTSDAIQMAQQLDPKGDRTIGVLTKIDIMDKGTNALKMLKGQEIPLQLGYVGVKLRSNQDIKDNLTVAKALINEKEFFAKHSVYSSIPGDLFGTQMLTSKLTNILYRHIRSFLPDLMKEINKRTSDLEEKVVKMGPGLPVDDRDKLHYIWQLINEFSVRFKNSISGSYQKSSFSSKPTIPAGSRIREQFSELLQEEQENKYKALKQYSDNEIQQIIYKYEGDNIPGFLSVDAFNALLNPELKKLKRPVQNCVEETYAILEEYANNILVDQLDRLPAVKELIQEQVLRVIRNCRDNTLNAVNEVLDAEISYMFTNDVNFLCSKPFDPTVDQNKGYDAKANPLVTELRKKIEHYYKLVIRAVRDNIPKLIGHFLVRGCQNDMLLELQDNLMMNQDYLQVVSEPQHIVQERSKLQREVLVLKNAQKIIKKDPDLSEYILKLQSNDEEQESTEQPTYKQQEHKQPTLPQVQPPQQEKAQPQQPQQKEQQAQAQVQAPTQAPKTGFFAQKPAVPASPPVHEPVKQTPPPTNPQLNQQQQQNVVAADPLSRHKFISTITTEQQAQKPKATLGDKYSAAVDQGVDKAMADPRTQEALKNGARQGAAQAVAQNLPGAPSWVTNGAQKAAEAAVTSDAAQNAIKDSMKQQLKDPILGTATEVPEEKKVASKSLFGFIGKK